MKYKQYVVTKSAVSHVFVYEDDILYDNPDLSKIEEIGFLNADWDTVDSFTEFIGEFDENGK
jgi:hypothetical protein